LGQIRRIKELLYDEGYTIPGARRKLAREEVGGEESEPTGEQPALSDGLIWAAGDKAGGAALHLSAAERAADRIEALLDELLLDSDASKGSLA
jgi:hypothetical protein